MPSIDTVSDLTPRVQYVASAAQTLFPYPFPIFQDADLVVDVDGVIASLNTHYTVSGEGDDLGGDITWIGTAMAGGEIVTIYRDIAIERDTDVSQNGPWSSQAYNNEQDKIFLILQQLKAQLARSLRSPIISTVDDVDLELDPTAYANMYLAFDANGNPVPAMLVAGTLTQAAIGAVLYPRTAAEIAAGVTPTDYFIASHEATGGVFLVERYGPNTTPGTTVMDTPISRAISTANSSRGGTIKFRPEIYRITSNITLQSYVSLMGTYGESNYPSTLPGGGTANTGTQLLWAGGASGKMVNATNVRMFTIDGLNFNGNGNTTVTAIWIDSTNDPSGSQINIKRFNVRDCFHGVQWGSSGLTGGSYANDGIVFDTFTIWSNVANSVGFTINSGNAGQMAVIRNGGIQVQALGIDAQACDILRIEQVFMGGQMNEGGIKAGLLIRATIAGCSSECWGTGQSSRSDAAYFMKTTLPASAFPLVESSITMIGNEINNDIILDYPARITSLGDNWGYRKIVATGLQGPAIGYANAATAYNGATPYTANRHVVSSGGRNYLCTADVTGTAPPNTSFWSASKGKSRVTAINNGTNPDSIDVSTGPLSGMLTHGWIDGAYINLTIRDAGIGMYTPAHNAARYTANSGNTWTVTGPQVETFAWTIDDRKMTIEAKINASTVGGAGPSSLLNILIPAGKIASKATLMHCYYSDSGVTNNPGLVYTGVGSTVLNFQKATLANWTAGTNTLNFKITFEVE